MLRRVEIRKISYLHGCSRSGGLVDANFVRRGLWSTLWPFEKGLDAVVSIIVNAQSRADDPALEVFHVAATLYARARFAADRHACANATRSAFLHADAASLQMRYQHDTLLNSG